MKRKLAALLCAAVLAVPALCVSEMTDEGYTCDSCGYAGSFAAVKTGTETRDGLPGEWFALQCPGCGAVYAAYWQPAEGNAEPEKPAPSDPEPSGTVLQDPPPEAPAAPAEPEAPAAIPQEPAPEPAAAPEAPAAPPQNPSPDTNGGGNGGQQEPPVILPAENREPSAPQAAETMPPVPAGNPGPASADAPSGQALQEPSEGNGPQAGNPAARIRRNVRKYPYFSEAYPSRRLNMEGDPEALAPVPGERIWPEPAAEGSSILQHMLNGD